ncbi:MAG: hypothetical protein HY821_21805 [Acidobacteria bacterium]|nr:hypothetical protein [Acidobacteriota bacterium]
MERSGHPVHYVPFLSLAGFLLPCLSCSLLLTLAQRPCAAQQPAIALITDQPAPELSGNYSLPPSQFRLAANGRVLFSSGGATAVFDWDAANGVPRRLLQTNDLLGSLGIPLSESDAAGVLDSTGHLLQINAAGHAAVAVTAAVKGAVDPAAVLFHDGSSFQLLKTALDSVTEIAVNNQDRVAVLGMVTLPTFPNPFQGLYIAAPGADPIEVAFQGKPAPSAIGGTYSRLRQIIGFNNSGHLAFLADVSGGNAVRAIFLYDGAEVRVVAKNGTAQGAIQSFDITPPTSGVSYLLNNNSKIAFRAATVGANVGVFVADASGAIVKLGAVNEPSGVEGLGNCSGIIYLRGFNDADRVLYDCLTMPGARNALLLRGPEDPAPRAILQRGQAIPGVGDFLATQQASLNNSGQVAVLASLSSTATPYAWLFAGDSDPVKIAAESESAPLGGAFLLAGRNAPALLNDAGQVVFLSDIGETNAVALFSWSASAGLASIVSSNDPLPEGANTVLRAVPFSGGSEELLVQFRRAGGQSTYFAKSLNPNAAELRKIVSEFDNIPGLGVIVSPDNLALNSKGEVAFNANLLGARLYPTAGILASIPGAVIQASVLAGETGPSGEILAALGPPRLNGQSQLAFQATTIPAGPPQPIVTQIQGIYVAPISPGPDGLQAIARQGDPVPGGGTFATWPTVFSSLALNEMGAVAFRAIADNGAAMGLYVGAPGAPLQEVVRTGRAVAGEVRAGNGIPAAYRLNDRGQVAFLLSLTGGGRSAGVFLATPGADGYTLQPIAMNNDSAPAPGSAAKFSMFFEEAVELNNAGQVAFFGGLQSANFNGGWFAGSGSANLALRAYNTQRIADNLRIGTFLTTKGGAALTDSGHLAVFVTEMIGPGPKPRIFVAAPDSTLRSLAISGDRAPGLSADFGKLLPNLSATRSGGILFNAILLNDALRAATFLATP